MNVHRLFILVLLPMMLAAQGSREAIPLKHWAAPLYWLPGPAESRTPAFHKVAGRAVSPQAQPASGYLVFVAMTPCRLVDTRSGSGFTGDFGPPSLAANAGRTFPILTSPNCAVPLTAQAYSLNVTAIPPGFLGFVTLYPTGTAQPNVSTLNDYLGTVVANAAIVPAGTSGSIDVVASNITDIVIDINGYYASPSDGSGNTAIGAGALNANTSGSANTAIGAGALGGNPTGYNNTALGYEALQGGNGTYGNVAIGFQAGILGGTNSIYIGDAGGGTGEDGVIRIGCLPICFSGATSTSTYIAGISGATTANSGAVPVVIDGSGNLGTISSSRRYKEDIQDMGDASSGLLRLRPVTFRYKRPYADGSKPLDYGLIAEEVAEVYPDLTVKGKDGQIETVQYQKLNSMLLNEVQKQHRRIEEQDKELGDLKARLSDLEKAVLAAPLRSDND